MRIASVDSEVRPLLLRLLLPLRRQVGIERSFVGRCSLCDGL